MANKYVKNIRWVNRQGSDKIDWTDGTFNPGSGCSGPDGKGQCEYCYNKRFWEMKGITTPVFYPERLEARFDKLAPGTKIFVGSATDIFDPAYSDEQIQLVIDMMRKHSHIIFQLLTKRPTRYADFEFPSNCWLGVTVTSQADVERIGQTFSDKISPNPNLNIRFVSIEPLLSPIPSLRNFLPYTNWIIIGRLTGHKEPYGEIEFYHGVNDILQACDKLKTPVFIKNNVHKNKGEAIWHPKERHFEPLYYPNRQEFPEATRFEREILHNADKTGDATIEYVSNKPTECNSEAIVEKEPIIRARV